MKRVFNKTAEVAHLWAHQAQSDARASSVSFRGTEFYSYRTCVAKLHNRNGQQLALVSANTYSNTTARHLSHVRRALRDVVRYMTVDDVDPKSDHTGNITWFLEGIELLHGKALRARTNRIRHIADANTYIRELQEYAEFFGVEVPENKYSTEMYKTDDELSELAEAYSREQERRYQEQRTKEIALQAERLERWVSGEAVHGYFHETKLRVKGDEIQTSRGASIPVADAIRFWPMIQRVHTQDKRWVPEQEIKLGHYKIAYMTAQELVVGCHHIPYAELERMAVQLKLHTPEEATC